MTTDVLQWQKTAKVIDVTFTEFGEAFKYSAANDTGVTMSRSGWMMSEGMNQQRHQQDRNFNQRTNIYFDSENLMEKLY